MRILVVEDNRDGGEALRLLLTELGHTAMHVQSGESALEVTPRFAPEVVIMDLGLPGMQGHEAIRLLRQRMGGRELAVIVVSGWGREEDRARSTEAGVAHHLVKPVDLSALMSILDSLEAKS